MTINFGLAIDIAAAGAVSSGRKRIDIAPLKLMIASHAEWVCAAEIFPQMGRAVPAPGRPFAARAKGKTDTRHFFEASVLVVFAGPDQLGPSDVDLSHLT